MITGETHKANILQCLEDSIFGWKFTYIVIIIIIIFTHFNKSCRKTT